MTFSGMAAGIIFSVFAFPSGVQVCAAQQICPEDRYVALKKSILDTAGSDSTENFYNLYDSEGRLSGETLYSPDVGYAFLYLKKGGMYRYTISGEVYIQNTDTLETVMHYDNMRGKAAVGSRHFCYLDFQEGSFSIYDSDGSLLCKRMPEALSFLPGRSMERSDINSIFIRCVETDRAVIGRVALGNPQDETVSYAILIDRNGTASYSDEEGFPELLLGDITGTTGEYFLIGEGYDGALSLCTEEGVILMKGVSTGFSGIYGDTSIRHYGDSPGSVPYILMPVEDNKWRVFDSSLEEVGIYEGERLIVNGDYAIGLPCSQLGGRICEGTAKYCNEREIPWTTSGDGYDFWNGTSLMHASLPPSEKPEKLNDQMVYTKETTQVDGIRSTIYHLRPLSDPSVDYLQEYTEGGETDYWVFPEKDSCLLGNPRWWDGGTSIIIDSEAHPVFTTRGRVEGSFSGNYYLSRGPYEGIIDRNGNWLIKEYSYAE